MERDPKMAIAYRTCRTAFTKMGGVAATAAATNPGDRM
jgi:hypothetical protein